MVMMQKQKWGAKIVKQLSTKVTLIKKKYLFPWKCENIYFFDVTNSLSSLHIFICLNSCSSLLHHTPTQTLNLSSYYLFPIFLSLSLPSIHLSSALVLSLPSYCLNPYSQQCRDYSHTENFSSAAGWILRAKRTETSCRNVDHHPVQHWIVVIVKTQVWGKYELRKTAVVHTCFFFIYLQISASAVLITCIHSDLPRAT